MHEQLNQCILNEVTCVHGCVAYNFPQLNDIIVYPSSMYALFNAHLVLHSARNDFIST